MVRELRQGRVVIAVGVAVTKIASTEQVDYRLHEGHGCDPRPLDTQVEYRADGSERPLVWIGDGLGEFGIEPGTAMTASDFDAARLLMAGANPVTGEVLVAPKLAVPHDAKLPLSELVTQVELAALAAGKQPGELFTVVKHRDMFDRAARAVERTGSGASLRADEAGIVAEAAGLTPGQVWGQAAYGQAIANLTTTTQHVDGDGVVTVVQVPRRQSVGNMGYDMTFTFPKSYSVLMAFAETDRAQGIETAMAASVADTFGWVQAHTSYGMRGKHGAGHTAEKVPTSGFCGWTMTHRSARPVDGAPVGDPHWHMHVTFANMARGVDGKWGTVGAGGRDLIRHARAADMLAQAQARHRLADEFGCRFVRSPRTGEWEVAHIPEPVIHAFSKRGVVIAEMLEGFGFDPATASRAQRLLAASRTREAKTSESVDASDQTLREIWQTQARRLGVDPHAIAVAAMAGRRDAANVSVDSVFIGQVVDRLQSAQDGLTATRRRFSTVDAIAAVADCLPEGAHSVDDIEALAAVVLGDAGFVALPESGGVGRDRFVTNGQVRQLAHTHMGHAQLFTTVDVVHAESVILSAAAGSRDGQGSVMVTSQSAAMARTIVETGQGYELSGEQVAVMDRLVGSDRMLDAVVGGPGTGKTTLMRACRTAWEAEGFSVGGAATQATTGHNLCAESGISSATIASILASTDAAARARLSIAAGMRDAEGIADPHNPTPQELEALAVAPVVAEHRHAFIVEQAQTGGLANLDVFIVDEASMTDDRSMARLITEAQRTGTKVVLIGDDKQLRGVGCGSLFARIHADVDGASMTDNRRQNNIDERQAIAAWRDGDYETALSSWDGRGKIAVTETSDQALSAMVADWMRMRDGAPDPHTEMRGLVMLAHTNTAVNRLNEAAQAVRVAQGETGPLTRCAGRHGTALTFAPGDHVIVRINDRNQANHSGDDVLNGFRGVIEGINDDGVAVAWQHDTPDGRTTARATLGRDYIAAGGLELGYAMTVHRSQGLTIRDTWTASDGSEHGGTVLKYGPSDAASSLVGFTRHTNDVRLYVAREQVEDSYTTEINGGPPADDAERTRRVLVALGAHARATETTVNDRPVHDDLNLTPVDPPNPVPEPTLTPEEAAQYEKFKRANRGTDGRTTLTPEEARQYEQFKRDNPTRATGRDRTPREDRAKRKAGTSRTAGQDIDDNKRIQQDPPGRER